MEEFDLETDFVVLHLFGDREGLDAAREMDRTIEELPGLAGTPDLRARRTRGRRAEAPDRTERSRHVAGRARVRRIRVTRAGGSWCPRPYP